MIFSELETGDFFKFPDCDALFMAQNGDYIDLKDGTICGGDEYDVVIKQDVSFSSKPKTINSVQANRLVKLANFLENLPDEMWDYSVIRTQDKRVCKTDKATKISCGTTACAIGWTPNVFPEHIGSKVEYDSVYDTVIDLTVYLKKNKNLEIRCWASDFFGLSKRDVGLIFLAEDCYNFYGVSNPENVTRKMVADKLYEIVKYNGYEVVSC